MEAAVRFGALTFSSVAVLVVPPVFGYILAPAMNCLSTEDRMSLALVAMPFNVHVAGKK